MDSSRDRIIFVGDLINKGPDSKGAYEIFKGLDAEVVMGNHEYALWKIARGEWLNRRPIYKNMRRAFGRGFDSLIDDIETWPYYIKEKKFVVVHAGRIPGVRLKDSDPEALVNIRTWDGKGHDLQHPCNPPWFKFL